MKRFFIKLAIFSCFLLICYIGFIAFFANFGLSNRNIYTQMGVSPSFLPCRIHEIKSQEFKDIDVLFCGSSGAYRDFDVRVFRENGITSFNLGSSAQTPLQTEILLGRYLDSLSPKTIIFEVSPDLMGMDGIESSIELISSDYFGFDFLKMCISQESLYCLNTMAYGIMYDLLSREDEYATKLKENQRIYGESNYVSGGYVETSLKYNKDFSKNINPMPCSIKKEQLKCLRNCVEMAKSRNISYLLIECPVSKNLYESYENHDLFVKRMSSLGTFINYNAPYFLNDSLNFYDLHHLNQLGVNLFNKKLISDLDSLSNQRLVRN